MILRWAANSLGRQHYQLLGNQMSSQMSPSRGQTNNLMGLVPENSGLLWISAGVQSLCKGASPKASIHGLCHVVWYFTMCEQAHEHRSLAVTAHACWLHPHPRMCLRAHPYSGAHACLTAAPAPLHAHPAHCACAAAPLHKPAGQVWGDCAALRREAGHRQPQPRLPGGPCRSPVRAAVFGG